MRLIDFVFRHRWLVFSIVLIFSSSLPPLLIHETLKSVFRAKVLRKNYMQVMQALNDISTVGYFVMQSVLSPEPQTYGIVQCDNDLSPQDCHICFNEEKKQLTGCLPAIGGSIFMEGCFLRYEQYNFFNETNEEIDGLEPICGDPTDITSDKYMD